MCLQGTFSFKTSKYIIVKTLKTQNQESVLEDERENQVTYKDRPIRIKLGCSKETFEARRFDEFQVLNDHKNQSRLV